MVRRTISIGGTGNRPRVRNLKPRLVLDFTDQDRFGILMKDSSDPRNPKEKKKLPGQRAEAMEEALS